MIRALFVLLLFGGFISCVEIPNSHNSLPPGEWRAYLKLYDTQYGPDALIDSKDQLNYKELPFNFSIEYLGEDSIEFVLLNGEEELRIAEVTVGIDRATAKDTVIIDFPVFNSYMKGIYENGVIEGNWYVKYRNSYSIPFIAQHGQAYRFTSAGNNSRFDLTGRWKTTFEFDNEDEAYMAVGEFSQDDEKILGTFRTETGDYRYLEGNVKDNKLYFSTFDGAHAFLFEALINSEDELVGIFKSGKHYTSNWFATRDDTFEIGDPSKLTKAVSDEMPIEIEFEDLNGDLVNLNDPQFNARIKLVNIMGTWCPNCLDEINFLKSFIAGNKYKEQIELVSISFERYEEKEKSIEALRDYKSKMGIDWIMLYGGYADKKENLKQLPFLDTLMSYPTLLVLDRDNKVKYVHTGFDGPATSRYLEFVQKFEKVINQVIVE